MHWLSDEQRITRDGFSALLAQASANRPERIRGAFVPRAGRTSPVQGAGTGGALPRAAPKNLRSTRQPDRKRIRPGGSGEDEAVLGGRTQPCDSQLSRTA